MEQAFQTAEAAAQERETRLREALQGLVDNCDEGAIYWSYLDAARAALAAEKDK